MGLDQTIPKALHKPLLYGAALGLAIVAYQLYRKGLSGVTSNVVSGVVGGVADVASGIVTGTALGIGDAVGLPRTDKNKCQMAMAAGDNWTASFECDAPTFLKWQLEGAKNKLKDLL